MLFLFFFYYVSIKVLSHKLEFDRSGYNFVKIVRIELKEICTHNIWTEVWEATGRKNLSEYQKKKKKRK